MASPIHSNCIIRLSTSDGNSGIEVTVDYANFLSLELERVWGDSADKFTLKLLDSTAYEVESIILAGSRNLYLRYYTDDGDHTVLHPKAFEGSIWDYSVDFINDKTILTITGTCGVSVKDIYTLYNRLWNKVPVLSEDITQNLEAWWGEITSHPDEIIKFRYALTDSGEAKFQVSLAYSTEVVNGKEVRKPYYFDCDMINIPVRPSDLVRLIASGGKLSDLSPFNSKNKDIAYDDFAESGFNFGTYTDSSGNSKPVDWSTACAWRANYSDILGGSLGVMSDTSLEVDSNDVSLVRKTIATVIVIEQYFKTLGKVESAGWTIGNIEKTEPICADLSQVKLSNTKYISDVLASKSFTSISNNNSTRANYYLYFRDNKLYFEPAKIEASPKAKIIIGQYLNPNAIKEEKGNGDIYAGDMILSYSYTSNTAAYIAGEGGNEMAGINYTTGEAINAEGLSAKSKEKLGVIEASYTDFNQGAIPTLSGVSSTSVSELVGNARSDWEALAKTSFKAEVQILGNLNLECGDYIEIINIPGGKMGKHHTSGIYLIMKIKESITKGTYLSTLTLVKNAANSGAGVSVKK